MVVPGGAAPRPSPSPVRPTRPAAPPPDDLEEPPAPRPRRRRGDEEAEPKPPKSKKGLLIGLIAGGVGLLAVCCCGVGIGGYFVWPVLSDSNPKVTKENFARLQGNMSLGDVENILGPGRPATSDDVSTAHKWLRGAELQDRVNRWKGSIDKGAVYRWKNGNTMILIAFGGPPKEGGKAKVLFYSNVLSNGHQDETKGFF
jgi:hypothetical protein